MKLTKQTTVTATLGEGNKSIVVVVECDKDGVPTSVKCDVAGPNGGPPRIINCDGEMLERVAACVDEIRKDSVMGWSHGVCAEHGYFDVKGGSRYRCPICHPEPEKDPEPMPKAVVKRP